MFLVVALLLGFGVTFVLTPMAREFLVSSGIVGIDQQKPDKPTLPTSGGIPVLFGFMVAVTSFIGMRTFLGGAAVETSLVFASLSSVLTIALIGLIDDVHVKEEAEAVKEEAQRSIGFRAWWAKPVFVLPAALPLMVVKAGDSMMMVPIFGRVDFGLIYPLVFVPLAVVAVSNATNMLAGQNGLEAGMGAVALSSLGIFAYVHGSVEAAVIALGMAVALGAFLCYNFYPSSILPGDSLTYGIGASFAAATIIGDVERFAILIFLPWILEAVLKLRSRFQASSLGELQEDGSLRPKHDRIYSLTHVLMRGGMTERKIVIVGILMETVLCVIAFMVFL